MGLTPEELINRLDRLGEFEARLVAATDPTSDNPPSNHDAPPPDSPTLRSAIATNERILARLERAIQDTPASRQGQIDYSRLLTNYRDTIDYLASLRARLTESDSTPDLESRPRGYLVAWSMCVSWLDVLKHARDQRVITQAQADHLWHALLDDGILDHTGYSPEEALAAHRAAVAGQVDLDAEAAQAA